MTAVRHRRVTDPPDYDYDGVKRAPWYIQVGVRVGIPTVAAAALLWWVMNEQTGNLKDLKELALQQQLTNKEFSMVQANSLANQARIITLLNDATVQNSAMIRALTALCYNSAGSANAQNRCTSIFGPAIVTVK